MASKARPAIEIKPINIMQVDITIRGTSPLITHNWSHKAKREMLDKQRGKKVTSKHEIKIPVNDFMDSLYWLTKQPEHGNDDDDALYMWERAISNDARFGFPVAGIKQAIIMGAYRAGLDVKQTELRGLMFIVGRGNASTTDVAEIVGPTPVMREDMVRVGGMSKSADVRYRAEFKEWEIPLRMRYHADGKYTIEQVLNMIGYGGMYCGIGEWRPEKDGQFGMFELKA
jgi:hypothetical protein